MLFSLQELELRPISFDVDLPPGEIEFDTKLKQASVLHVEGTAKLLNSSLGEIRMEGDLRVKIEGVCDRCVEAASYPIENHFDLVYMPAEEAASSSENEIDGAGLEVGYYEGNGLELNDVLREVVLLALPMRLVCQEDCKGICPVCGQNRNASDCGCRQETGDDRWSKLKMLRAEIAPRN